MKGNRGFTLIEIVVAAAILSLVLPSVTALFLQSGVINKESKGSIVATVIAQDKIEELKALSLTELGDKQIDQERISSNGISFMRRSAVIREDTNLFIISVKVLWDGGEVELVTYRGDY